MVSLTTWRRDLLRSRGLLSPTGDPLFTLQLDDLEYKNLRVLLVNEIVRLDQVWPDYDWINVNLLQRISPEFPSLFVLFASAWWSRYYSGQFDYQPIFDELETNSIDNQDLTKIIESGFDYWKIKIDKSRGMAYIREISVNAGIPLSALEHGSGLVAKAIEKVSIDASKYGYGYDEIRDSVEVELKKTTYSASYSKIINVIASFVSAMLDFRNTIASLPSSDTSDLLSALDDTWTRRFPIYLGSDQAKKFINSLLRRMKGRSEKQRTQQASVTRRLTRDRTNPIISTIEFPTEVSFDEILIWSNATHHDAVAPDFFEVLIVNGSFTKSFAIQRSIGEQSYKFQQFKAVKLGRDEDLFEPTYVTFISPTTEYRVLPNNGQTPLDRDLPWVFEGYDNEQEFLGNGSIATTGSKIFVVFNSEECTLEPETSDELHVVGANEILSVGGQTRSKVALTCNTKFTVAQGRYGSGTIKLRQPKNLKNLNVTWQHRYVMDLAIISSSLPIFVSKPIATIQGSQGSENLIVHAIDDQSGGCKILIAARGDEIVATKRAIVLPKDAKIEHDPERGTLKLTNWGIEKVEIDKFYFDVERSLNHVVISKSLTATGEERAVTPLRLTLSGTQQIIEAKIPNLTSSAYFYLANDKEVSGTTTAVTVSDFIGAKLRLTLAKPRSIARVIVRATSPNVDPYRNPLLEMGIDFDTNKSASEYSLATFASRLRPILVGINHVDPVAVVEVNVDKKTVLKIIVKRYQTRLDEVDTGAFRIISNDNSALPAVIQQDSQIRAICLKDPSKIFDLIYNNDSDTWSFGECEILASSYFLFEGEAGQLNLRPRIFSGKGDEVKNPSKFAEALDNGDEESRRTQLLRVMRERHNEMGEFWAIFNSISSNVSHLPAYNFDFWKYMVNDTSLVAEVLLNPLLTMEIQDLKRILDELDFNPVLISKKEWEGAIDNTCQLVETANLPFDLFATVVMNRVEKVGAIYPYMNTYLNIITGNRLTPNAAMNRVALLSSKERWEKAHDVEEGNLQKLLRRRADKTDWPTEFKDLLTHAKLPDGLQRLVVNTHNSRQMTVANLPIILAYLSLHDYSGTRDYLKGNLNLISKYRNFDNEYFNAAFEVAVEFLTLKEINN